MGCGICIVDIAIQLLFQMVVVVVLVCGWYLGFVGIVSIASVIWWWVWLLGASPSFHIYECCFVLFVLCVFVFLCLLLGYIL